jgi:hypothetical protein
LPGDGALDAVVAEGVWVRLGVAVSEYANAGAAFARPAGTRIASVGVVVRVGAYASGGCSVAYVVRALEAVVAVVVLCGGSAYNLDARAGIIADAVVDSTRATRATRAGIRRALRAGGFVHCGAARPIVGATATAIDGSCGVAGILGARVAVVADEAIKLVLRT